MLNPTITPPTNNEQISIGDHVFLDGAMEEIGAVRAIRKNDLLVYVEGAGDFPVPHGAVVRARYGKVMLDPAQLSEQFLDAAKHAHDNETL